MVALTFFGGAGEIGGNKILLQDKDARIYLDFGQSFDFGEDFFYDYLQPRAAHGLEVYFEFGLIPKIPRLYSREMLELTDLPYEKPDIDAVFISHSHSDHVNHLPFLDSSIPVYLGHGTHKITELYHTLYPSICNLGEHDFRFFKSGDKIKVKHLIIEPIHVEHSVPGAYGFIIHTSSGPLVYTGDFRLHGPQSRLTSEFLSKAASSKPTALLIEGTRVGGSEGDLTEAEVEEKVESIIRSTSGIVFAYFSMSNVDRFMSIYKAAVRCGRKVVVDTRFAYILDNLREKIAVLPDVMADPNILVYFRLCKSGTFCLEDYYKFERKYMSRMVTYREVSASQSSFVMHMGFNKLMELVYIQPSSASYIYSSSEHFLEGEDNEAERTVLENWMKHFNVSFHKAHCSGHASASDIATAVKKINPLTLIPIHTLNAGEFKKFHGRVVIPNNGETIRV